MRFLPQKAFTLAELLIALAILGVIATFTIPKVLTANQNAKNNAMAKEAASMISGAYDAYKIDNTVSAATIPSDLFPYMNYVKLDTTTTIDELTTSGSTVNCSVNSCILLHSGARIRVWNASFNGTAATNAIMFMFDPDGVYGGSGSADSPSKSILFFLYYTGKIRTYGTIDNNTKSSDYTRNPTPAYDPSWFSWN